MGGTAFALINSTKLKKPKVFLTNGEVAEWSMATDCKSVRASVRRFKSCLLHHSLLPYRLQRNWFAFVS